MIVPIDRATPDEAGGKAAGLRRLVELGLPVPPCVVVPVSSSGKIGDEDADRVVAELGEPLAVRSSARGEDAEDRSAAGQFESLMEVRRADLQDAVARVWASGRSDRAIAYGGADEMAIVIQRQVPASRSGVAFSRDPLGRDGVVIECVFGHGEQLVSGSVTPDWYHVAPAGDVEARLAPKPGPYRLLRTLRDDEATAVASLALRAEEGFGRAVDVEFCFEGRSLWLVQCRPITTFARPEAG